MRRSPRKNRGSSVRDWIEAESAAPGFADELDRARARRRIAREIHAARTKRGVSQPELARRIRTSQAAVSRMENGGQNMTIDIVENIARALGGRFEGRIVFERP